MNRELLVRLIKKNIDELIMLTDGFMEMTSYPEAIIGLAKNKTDDIWNYINQLGNIKDIDEVESVEEEKEVKEISDVNIEHVDVEANRNSPDQEEDSFDAKKYAPEVEEDTPEIIKTNQHDDDDDVPKQSETPKQTLAEKLSTTVLSRNEALAKENNGDVNINIGQAKVDDIRQAISLGDRFRFQRELFNNNGEDMNKTLAYINKLATYKEVIDFLSSKYAWAKDNTAAEDFYQIVKRKF